MMTCQQMVENLSHIIDGEAPLSRRLSFYFHLALCPPCRSYFKQFRFLHETLGQVQPQDLSEDFFRVMEKVLEPSSDSSPPQQIDPPRKE